MFARYFIKPQMQICYRLVIIVSLLMGTALSRAAVIVNFDEFGNGTVQTTAGTTPLISLGNIVDPVDPTNGLFPLVYNLAASVGAAAPIVPGDLLIGEPPAGQNTPSDLVRFTPNGLIVVYSDRAEPGEFPIPLADVGFPQTGVFQPNAKFMLETGPEAGPNGIFGYTPAATDPGFFPTPPGPMTYNFLSDGAVPEPAALGWLGAGACVLLARRRRR